MVWKQVGMFLLSAMVQKHGLEVVKVENKVVNVCVVYT